MDIYIASFEFCHVPHSHCLPPVNCHHINEQFAKVQSHLALLAFAQLTEPSACARTVHEPFASLLRDLRALISTLTKFS